MLASKDVFYCIFKKASQLYAAVSRDNCQNLGLINSTPEAILGRIFTRSLRDFVRNLKAKFS